MGKQDDILAVTASKTALSIHTPATHTVLDRKNKPGLSQCSPNTHWLSAGFTVREWLTWLVSSDALLTPCGHRNTCASESGANKVGRRERLGFAAVYSSAQTTHSSPADVPAALLVRRIDEPSTQVSSRSLYIDKAIMHAFLLCITVSSLLRQMGCQNDTFPHTSALCCEEDGGSIRRVRAGVSSSAAKQRTRPLDPPTNVTSILNLPNFQISWTFFCFKNVCIKIMISRSTENVLILRKHFNNSSSRNSKIVIVWSVFLCVFNLCDWFLHKKSNFMMGIQHFLTF